MGYERSMGMGFSDITTFWGQPESCSEVAGGRSRCYTPTTSDIEHARAAGCRNTSRSCRTTSGNQGIVWCCPPAQRVAGAPEAPGALENWFCSGGVWAHPLCSAFISRRVAEDLKSGAYVAAAAQTETTAAAMEAAAASARATAAEADARTALLEALPTVGVVVAVGTLGLGGLLWWRRRKLRRTRRRRR